MFSFLAGISLQQNSEICCRKAHSHISYVQVGPDFIHRCETHRAGIQDDLQFFNEQQVL